MCDHAEILKMFSLLLVHQRTIYTLKEMIMNDPFKLFRTQGIPYIGIFNMFCVDPYSRS